MRNSAEEILKIIPDFDDFIKLADEIAKLSYDRTVLETSIKDLESRVFETASTNTQYFQNGKQPSTAFIEKTWSYRGIDGEIMPLRLQLAEIVRSLDERKLRMEVYKAMLEVWRTLSANSRAANL